MKFFKGIAVDLIRSLGCEIRRAQPSFSFSGEYADGRDSCPRVTCRPGDPKWYAGKPVIFRIDNGAGVLEQEVLYSSLTLLKMIKHFEFRTLLDIGSHAGNAANVFRHIGKTVTTCELSPGYAADYKADYLTIDFSEKFDAIWCSQVLEHQRDIGKFLTKVFDDLKEGGVLALTVPHNVQNNLDLGHCNIFSPLLLMYHLVMAGFDCGRISLKCYDGNIGVLVKKKYNGIKRDLPRASLMLCGETAGDVEIDGKVWNVRELLGDEIFDDMHRCFPVEVCLRHSGTEWRGSGINWGDPI